MHLATREKRGKPRQASLRRAISSAHYSLFRLVVDDATRQLIAVARFRGAVARAIEHVRVRRAAEAVIAAARPRGGGGPGSVLLTPPIAPALVQFCSTFVDLLGRRQEADYGSTAVTRAETLRVVSLAQAAHALWTAQRKTRNAGAFLFMAAGLHRDR